MNDGDDQISEDTLIPEDWDVPRLKAEVLELYEAIATVGAESDRLSARKVLCDLLGAEKGKAEIADRPEIVVLCGSTRFYDEFQRANYDLTMQGKIVLSVGSYPHSHNGEHGEGVGHDSIEKQALDELHKRKIDLADRVLVLNVGGYIGDSTRSEIAYAEALGKPIAWLES